MATPQEAQREQEEFAAAYAEADPERKEMTEDEAFGLAEEPKEEKQEQTEAEGAPAEEPAADAGDAGTGEVASGDEAAPAVAIVIEPTADDSAAIPSEGSGEEEPTDPKDLQRKKSWEGRLRAREEELKAREEALKAKEKMEADEPTDEQNEPVVATLEEAKADIAAAETPQEAVEEASEAVDSGAMTPEQAMKVISGDFGDEFAKMLSVLIEHKAGEIAGKMADEKVGAVRNDLNTVVDDIVKHRADTHFEILSDAHPDFLDVAESGEFKDWVEGLPATLKERAIGVIQRGSARQIVKLLNIYKSDQKQPEQEQVDTGAADAAEGVRSSSGGMSLPDKPARDDSYEEAWSQF